jgi:predicted ArsR family transcriptional regulator
MNNKEYCKITESDVINILLRTSEHWAGCGIITPSNIAHLLKTSRYQINKHIKSLKSKDLLDYKRVDVSTNEDWYLPVNGYCLSKIGKETFKKELLELEKKECDLIQKMFGSKPLYL